MVPVTRLSLVLIRYSSRYFLVTFRIAAQTQRQTLRISCADGLLQLTSPAKATSVDLFDVVDDGGLEAGRSEDLPEKEDSGKDR